MQKYSSATLCYSHHQDKMDVNQVVPVLSGELDWQGTGEGKKKGERGCVHNHLQDIVPKKWSSVSL